jgi:hypothetical protein
LEKLPQFNLDEYRLLLTGFKKAGYTLQKVSTLNEDYKDPAVFLRHDVDLHISAIEPMAFAEGDMGVQSTYYVPVSLHFNPLYKENINTLRRLLDLEHEIGLHYDLSTYPTEPEEAVRHLKWEIEIIEKITGTTIKTICLHNPYLGQPDPFRKSKEYINPQDPNYLSEITYISDSCRAWRDDNLLKLFSPNPPKKVVLNTHPELWLAGEVKDRLTYVKTILLDEGTRQHRDYFNLVVHEAWKTHPAINKVEK